MCIIYINLCLPSSQILTPSLAISNTKKKENLNIHVPCEFLRMPLELVSLGVPLTLPLMF